MIFIPNPVNTEFSPQGEGFIESPKQMNFPYSLLSSGVLQLCTTVWGVWKNMRDKLSDINNLFLYTFLMPACVCM